MARRARRFFPPEFKADAVKLVRSGLVMPVRLLATCLAFLRACCRAC